MDVNLTPTPVNPEHARLDRERTDRQRRLPGFDQDAVAAARRVGNWCWWFGLSGGAGVGGGWCGVSAYCGF